MFDIGGLELLIIAAVALIVVGPKDLPRLVRNIGRWVTKARHLAREFQQGMEAAAKEADVDVDEFRQIGALKSDVERQAREMGRRAQKVLEGEDDEAPSPAPRREPRSAGGRVEPDFDSEFEPEFDTGAPRRAEPAHRSHRDAPPRMGERRAAAPEPKADEDDPLESFQRGMRDQG